MLLILVFYKSDLRDYATGETGRKARDRFMEHRGTVSKLSQHQSEFIFVQGSKYVVCPL